MALSKVIVKLNVRPDPLGVFLSHLRKAMIERRLRVCREQNWFKEIIKGYFKTGGSCEEMTIFNRCLKNNIPLVRKFYHDRLGNGGVRHTDPGVLALRLKFHKDGFTTEDFEKVVDMIVDEYFAEERKKFLESRFRH